MIPLITQHSDDIAEICRRHHVKRLELFGSAAVGDFDPNTSDLDFLVEFDESDDFSLFQTCRDLTQGLESLFNRSVDLVIFANVENPYFRTSVESTREPIYLA
ncbi:MAG: nucleotidyltransferase domain-containing protein [Chloroflexi bacterium]|nr:nucleotidyltransferase domain-containing protein [Chloroflexota bacterium]